jgi:hypothetical protein
MAAPEQEHIERVVEDGRRPRAVILEDIKRRLARFIESNNLAVDCGLIRQGGESLDDRWVTPAEIVVIARPQRDPAVVLDCERALPIEFDFVKPVGPSGRRSFRSRSMGSINRPLKRPPAMDPPIFPTASAATQGCRHRFLLSSHQRLNLREAAYVCSSNPNFRTSLSNPVGPCARIFAGRPLAQCWLLGWRGIETLCSRSRE